MIEFSMVQPNGKLIFFSPDKAKYTLEYLTISLLDEIKKEILEVFEALYVAKFYPYYLKRLMEMNTLLSIYQERIIEHIWNTEFRILTEIQKYQLN